jgi:hypothetical protein
VRDDDAVATLRGEKSRLTGVSASMPFLFIFFFWLEGLFGTADVASGSAASTSTSAQVTSELGKPVRKCFAFGILIGRPFFLLPDVIERICTIYILSKQNMDAILVTNNLVIARYKR